MLFSPLNILGRWSSNSKSWKMIAVFFRVRSAAICSWSGSFAHINPQWSISFNHHRDTVRGLHFQAAPHEEIKLVHCTRGAIFDVVVDLRPGSPTHAKWVA